MNVLGVAVRDFRSYREAHASLGSGLTVIVGPNGAGKTNLLEAIYFGCTGRSCRTTNEREVVRFKAEATRVLVNASGDDGPHELSVGFSPGKPKRMRVDGAPVERLLDVSSRPLVSVFLPDRLDLIKGPPSLRRAHLDQLVAGLWPSRSLTRKAYAQALAQRNALIGRVRGGLSPRTALDTWNSQLATHGIALMRDRERATAAIEAGFSGLAIRLGLDGEPCVSYRPRSRASDEAELTAELVERTERDIERGFTGHGPHRDDLAVLREGRELRVYGSQGQQRLALLALLLAERDAIGATRDSLPLMLLDDVMSELDGERRTALVELLREADGQSVISTTDVEHVPAADDAHQLHVLDGRVRERAVVL